MRPYVKPDVFYESYELSIGVAACSGIIIDKDGNVKEIVGGDPGFTDVIAMSGLFGGPCSTNYEDVNLEDYGYYGGSSAIWGSV